MQRTISALTIVSVVGLLATSSRNVVFGQSVPPVIEWESNLGVGPARSVRQTADGGYFVVTGEGQEGALIKTDQNGAVIWQRVSPGDLRSGQQTCDGGYIAAGTSHTGALPKIYVVKTDENGQTQWQTALGQSGKNFGHWVDETADEGYVVVGRGCCDGKGGYDVLVAKLAGDGRLLWQGLYGTVESDWGWSVQGTADGQYIVAGCTDCFVDRPNVYLLKVDDVGRMVWERSYPRAPVGTRSYSVQQTMDGGFILLGPSLIKTDANGDLLWEQNISGFDVGQTRDGGYVVMGDSLIKTDARGEILWRSVAGDSVQQTVDGGYIVARGQTLIKLAREPVLPLFLRGDCDGDGGVELPDAHCMINWLFFGGSSPRCLAASNANGDEIVDLADAVSVLSFLFQAGPPPVGPFPDCGTETMESDVDLACANAPVCRS